MMRHAVPRISTVVPKSTSLAISAVGMLAMTTGKTKPTSKSSERYLNLENHQAKKIATANLPISLGWKAATCRLTHRHEPLIFIPTGGMKHSTNRSVPPASQIHHVFSHQW